MRIGVDLGGSKISAVALDAGGRLLAQRRVVTPAGDYAATLSAVVDIVHAIEQATGRSGSVGIGTPGALSPASGLIKNANSTCLNGRPLDRDLAAALGREIRLANDADCFALSESSDGAASGARVVFGVILGTGTGGGVVIDGHLLRGGNAIAGEWGHNPLPWPRDEERPGPDCYCGKQGCIETFLSGPGLAHEYLRQSARVGNARQIVQLADAGDAKAQATLAIYIDRLARGLASVINILDPEVIVLGGGLSQIESLYRVVPQQWGRYVFSDTVTTRLLPPRHGDDSGVRGAACLWSERGD